MGHLLNHLFKPCTFLLCGFVLPSGLVVGELHDLLPHPLTVLSDEGEESLLIGRIQSLAGRGQVGTCCEDLAESGGFNLLHLLSAVLGAYELTHPTQTAPDGRVEVVLDGVVSPA